MQPEISHAIRFDGDITFQRVAPNVFADFTISSLPDGTEVAASPLVAEG